MQCVTFHCYSQCDSCDAGAPAKTWEGDVDADWNDPNNWSGNTLPGNENITVDGDLYTNAPIISVNSTFSPADVYIIDGATLTVQATLTLTDDFTIRNNSFLVIAGGSNASGDDINLCRGGTITMSGGTLDNTAGSGELRVCTTVPAAATGNTEIIITGGTITSTTSDTEGATTIEDFVTTSGGGTYADDVVALPVDLASFETQEHPDGILLKWVTYSETNNAHFKIQRSEKANAFTTIGMVDGNGSTNERHEYTFLDEHPYATNYYRLKQVDYDGEFEIFYPIYSSYSQKGDYEISASHGPNAELQIHSNEEPSLISIYSLSGTMMYQGPGALESVIDIKAWSSGIYIISINWERRIETEKFFIR